MMKLSLKQLQVQYVHIKYIHKRGDNMDENKKNEELIKFKKQWFNEDNQPVAGIELTLPPDIGSMLDSKSVDDESGNSNNE